MKQKLISVVIPTYNEAENVRILIPKIRNVLGKRCEIIVVDDNSQDGTAEVAKKLGSKVISRPYKMGLSSAIMKGIKAAKNEIVVVMDADLQHPPEAIPKLIKNSNSYDVVIASRYVKGGKIKGWSIFRKITSKIAISLAKLLLPNIREVKDPESGFFLVKRSQVLSISNKLKLEGFKFLLELLSVGSFRFKEVPYTFRSRKYGESKFNLKETLNYLLLLLKLSEYRPFKFGIVGTIGIGVNEGLLDLLVLSGLPLSISSPIAIELSILSNFILNDLWTFRKRRGGLFITRCLKYHGAVGLGAIVNFVTLLTLAYTGIHYLIANLIGIFLGFIANYIGSETIVWSKSMLE